MPDRTHSNLFLRNLPSVDEVLRTATAREIAADCGQGHATLLVRRAIEKARAYLGSSPATEPSRATLLGEVEELLGKLVRAEKILEIQEVINATGVVVHTNLGRAPLSEKARAALSKAAGYCTLEYDLATGQRGKRAPRSEQLICELTGAEAALVVNNCAAAAFFVLTAFAAGGTVIVSRGEQVEIGGDFRVPDVLRQSGATLKEVGTTNRTKLQDYENAIDTSTKMILRVHPSNYRIVGFTSSPALSELAELAQANEIILYEDIGSGALTDLSGIGIEDEPTVSASIAAGVDIITFSGDKLLGGPQSGIIAGRAKFLDQLRKHSLFRALRVDKLTYAALEATLADYLRESAGEIPVFAMLSMNGDQIRDRVERLRDQLGTERLTATMRSGASAVGGGAAPTSVLPTQLLELQHSILSAAALESRLRNADPPVIARIEDNKVILDLRTVPIDKDSRLLEILRAL